MASEFQKWLLSLRRKRLVAVWAERRGKCIKVWEAPILKLTAARITATGARGSRIVFNRQTGWETGRKRNPRWLQLPIETVPIKPEERLCISQSADTAGDAAPANVPLSAT